MSRTNVSVLIATVLLGVLLIVVLQLIAEFPVEDQAVATVPFAADPAAVPAIPAPGSVGSPAGLRRLTSHADLLAILEARGIDTAAALTGYREWMEEHGFFGGDPLFGIANDVAAWNYYESLDEPTLVELANAGDAGAMQALGSRLLLTDPFGATDWYTRAAGFGSIFAMTQIAALMDTFSTMSSEEFAGDPKFRQQLNRYRRRDLEMDTFAFLTAAVRDGGAAVVDDGTLAWLGELADRLGPERLAQACQTSVRLYMQIGAARRWRGKAPTTGSPPPVFLGVHDLYELLPCQDTVAPVVAGYDTSHCEIEPVLDHRGQLADLFVCM